jgi:hypothetical protein
VEEQVVLVGQLQVMEQGEAEQEVLENLIHYLFVEQLL